MARAARDKREERHERDAEPRTRAPAGAGRGIWSGSISFGLLQIPVTLHTAESRTEALHFRLLDKRDLSPIRYERVSTATGEVVAYEDIVKGYELDKDEFVVVEPDDFARANVKATQTVDIQDFVPRDQIDVAFFETPYFLVPQPRAKKAYVLLRRALAEKGAVAIATFVLRTREHLVAIMPAGDALMLEILRFGHQLKDAADLPLPSPSDEDAITEREVAMAEQLVDGMMTDWDPSKYRDRYYRDVMKIIEEKAKTGTVKEHHARTTGTVANDVVDLLELLKKSVEKRGQKAGSGQRVDGSGEHDASSGKPPRRPGPKKAAPRRKGSRGRAA